jgi:hypothetical protein
MNDIKKLAQKAIELNAVMHDMIGECYDDLGNVKKDISVNKLNLTNKVKHDIMNKMMVFSSLMLTIKEED